MSNQHRKSDESRGKRTGMTGRKKTMFAETKMDLGLAVTLPDDQARNPRRMKPAKKSASPLNLTPAKVGLKDDTINVRLGTFVKKTVQEVVESYGMTLSGAVNLLLARIISTDRLPFEPVPFHALMDEQGRRNNLATTMRVRIDASIKREASDILGAMGISPSAAVSLLFNTIAARREFPFDHETPNEETRVAMMRLEDRKGEKFESAAALFDDLGI